MNSTITYYRDYISINSLAVNSHALNTLANMVRICNCDLICITTELTCC